MEIKINKDLNNYKAKDIGMFSLKEAGFIGVALGVSALALWAEKSLFGEFYVATVLFTSAPILAPCFLSIKGHKLSNYIKLINKPAVYKKKINATPEYFGYENEIGSNCETIDDDK